MSGAAIEFRQVTRTFGKVVALDRLDLCVEPGRVLGLIGRNGAGKTTTLRLAHGLLWPDSGTIRILGLDPVKQGLEVRRRVALLSEENSLYPYMKVEEIIAFAARLHPRWNRERATELTRRLGLDPTLKIAGLSRGTKAKLALLLAVSGDPEVLLLDDPTAGLDPLVRREVLGGILEAIPGEGGSVIYASHLVQDIERVADDVVVLDDGRITLQGPIETLKAEILQAEAVFEQPIVEFSPIPGQIDRQVDGRVATITARANEEDLTRALKEAGAASIQIGRLSLEDILVACLRGGGKEMPRV